MAPTPIERLRLGDATLFVGDSAPTRLGWVNHLDQLGSSAPKLESAWRKRPPRHERTVVLGMGGSAATAGMFAGARASELVTICDTSNPDTIHATVFDGVNVIASSKSGGTIETITLLAWALSHGLEPRDLTVITDVGTALAELGHDLGAAVFYGDADVGGRFSALSSFGLLGAFAAGWSADELLESARGNTASLWQEPFERGVALADDRFCALAGSPRAGSGTLWLEQLLAESTGKDGRGLIPVSDRHGYQAFRTPSIVADIHGWHVSAAAAAWALGVDPFNQPDVDAAKEAVFTELRSPVPWHYRRECSPAERHQLERAGYVALQVFGPLSLEDDVDTLRGQLSQRFAVVTAGLGPRYQHSTGQLHKGGWADVVALQVVVRPRVDAERISGRNYSFFDLHSAQSRADAVAMRAAGRAVVRLSVEDLSEVVSAIGV